MATRRRSTQRKEGHAAGTSAGRPADRPSPLSPAEVEEFFRRLAEVDPLPTTELEYRDPFTLLVAVVLSAQATDKGVNRVTRELFRHARTPQDFVRLGEEGIARYIRSLGLWRAKARNLYRLSQILIERHGGQVPRTREELEALPGVGRKTANVVLNTVYGEPTIAVDTHVFRVANRTGLAPGRTPREVEEKLLRVVPEAYRRGAHHWLIRLGRYTCRARRPACWRCPVADLCRYPDKTPPPSAGSGRNGDTAG
ncbi:Endonuclease III [bacterium HR39]|nr:Endonuclease III [bacterium HR39]